MNWLMISRSSPQLRCRLLQVLPRMAEQRTAIKGTGTALPCRTCEQTTRVNLYFDGHAELLVVSVLRCVLSRAQISSTSYLSQKVVHPFTCFQKRKRLTVRKFSYTKSLAEQLVEKRKSYQPLQSPSTRKGQNGSWHHSESLLPNPYG